MWLERQRSYLDFQAQQQQLERQGCLNSHLSIKQVTQQCTLSTPISHWLAEAMSKLKLSARAYHRLLKVAKTLADLNQEPHLTKPHLTEALSYTKR